MKNARNSISASAPPRPRYTASPCITGLHLRGPISKGRGRGEIEKGEEKEETEKGNAEGSLGPIFDHEMYVSAFHTIALQAAANVNERERSGDVN